MAASDNLSRQFQNTRQLTLFEPAWKLADPSRTYFSDMEDWDIDPDVESPQDLVESKVGEAKEPGTSAGAHYPKAGDSGTLYESIRRDGVQTPIGLLDPKDRERAWFVDGDTRYHDQVLTDGHHRAFSAADIDPEMLVPVRWDGRSGKH